jgi:hypothetical protein
MAGSLYIVCPRSGDSHEGVAEAPDESGTPSVAVARWRLDWEKDERRRNVDVVEASFESLFPGRCD